MTDEATVLRRPAPRGARELELRAQALRGHSVADLAQALGASLPATSPRGKGFVGQLVECALGADPCAGSRPDFPELGVELKTIPVNAQGLPLESTFCCSIHMASADQQTWESSRLRRRMAHVLWVPVHAQRGVPVGERRFGLARLWQPSAAQAALLKADWEDLMGAIGSGRGGTLTAREGRVLQVRPKAAHAQVKTLGPGPEGPQSLLPLGFYLRTQFTAELIAGS